MYSLFDITLWAQLDLGKYLHYIVNILAEKVENTVEVLMLLRDLVPVGIKE